MAATLDLGQAAAAIGISKPGVIDAVKRGRLKRRKDGKFEAAEVAAFSENRRAPRGGETKKRPRVKPLSDANAKQAPSDPAASRLAGEAFAATLETGGMFVDRAAAELARDSYQARLRGLEYDEKLGRLVDVEKVNRAIASACAKVRTRLLAIPAERAPMIHRLKTAVEIQDALQAAVVEALEDLAGDFAKGF